MINILAPDLIDKARIAVLQTQSPSVAKLQATLRLPHSQANALIARFEQERLILPARPGRERMLHPRYRRMHVRVISHDPRMVYVRRVVETALFFFEMWEEGNDGYSTIIHFLKPRPSAGLTPLRKRFLKEWYGRDGMPLTDAALSFHRWLRAQDLCPIDNDGIETAIRTECLIHERDPVFSHTKEILRDRAYVRLAGYYRQMYSNGVNRDTRVPDYFILREFIPQGTSLEGTQHPEHVVPCAVLRDTAMSYFEQERSLDQVVKMLERCLVIVWISLPEKDTLDTGTEALKDRMPTGWNEESDCIYQRLHDKNIAFTLPAERARCPLRTPTAVNATVEELLIGTDSLSGSSTDPHPSSEARSRKIDTAGCNGLG